MWASYTRRRILEMESHFPRRRDTPSRAAPTRIRPLTERLGARRLLGQSGGGRKLLEAYAHLTDLAGRRRSYDGHLPDADRHWSGCGALSQACATEAPARRGRGFSSPHGSCLPISGAPSSRNSSTRLYLKGISTGDFCEALAAALGPEAPGLSASTIARLKEVWQGELEHWHGAISRPSVMSTSGPTASTPRLDHDKQCMCVIIADELGRKELRSPNSSGTPVLARSAARSQASRPGDCGTGHRRRGARFLEPCAKSTGTREQRCWVHSTSANPPRAKQHLLDGRDPRGGREGLRLPPMAPSTTKRWPAWPRTATCCSPSTPRPSGSTFAPPIPSSTFARALSHHRPRAPRRMHHGRVPVGQQHGSHQIADIIQGVKFKD